MLCNCFANELLLKSVKTFTFGLNNGVRCWLPDWHKQKEAIHLSFDVFYWAVPIQWELRHRVATNDAQHPLRERFLWEKNFQKRNVLVWEEKVLAAPFTLVEMWEAIIRRYRMRFKVNKLEIAWLQSINILLMQPNDTSTRIGKQKGLTKRKCNYRRNLEKFPC